jgi:phospholipid transport system substrate-binding protein
MKKWIKIVLAIIFAMALFSDGSGSLYAAVKGRAKTGGSPAPAGFKEPGTVDAPQGTPTWEIQDMERRLLDYHTGKALTPAEQQQNQQIKRQVMHGVFDLRELSRLALDKHWDSISSAEQDQFVDLLSDLLENQAIFSKEQKKTQGKSYLISYKGDQFLDGKTRARTKTQVFIPKESATVNIQYMLKHDGSQWKVFDVIVDNASLVDNYRFQFGKIIDKYGYPELVKRMREKLTTIKAKRQG